jgi:hypothetical protein
VIVCVVVDRAEHDAFVELDGEDFCVFGGLGFGGLDEVAVLVVVAAPKEAGGGELVDDKAAGVAVDGGDRLFDGVETILGFYIVSHGSKTVLKKWSKIAFDFYTHFYTFLQIVMKVA